MFEIINSLFPVFAVIVFGYVAKHYKFLTGEFWPGCEKLAYFVLLPLILFTNISTAPYHDLGSYLSMISASIISVVIVIVWLFAAKFILGIKNPDFTSIMQGSVYANAAYIGIPSAFALFGKDGLNTYSLLLAAIVPFVNAVTIIILGIYSHEQGNLFKTILKRLGLHPVIMACVFGFLINYFGISLPKPIFATLDMLGKAAVPVGLMIVGGALDIKALKGSWGHLNAASFVKLAVMPLVAIILAKWMGVSGLNANILVLYSTLPTAAATYILARRMKGNAPLMAGIIALQTALAFITMALFMGISAQLFPL